jgi:hypothetical protein
MNLAQLEVRWQCSLHSAPDYEGELLFSQVRPAVVRLIRIGFQHRLGRDYINRYWLYSRFVRIISYAVSGSSIAEAESLIAVSLSFGWVNLLSSLFPIRILPVTTVSITVSICVCRGYNYIPIGIHSSYYYRPLRVGSNRYG